MVMKTKQKSEKKKIFHGDNSTLNLPEGDGCMTDTNKRGIVPPQKIYPLFLRGLEQAF